MRATNIVVAVAAAFMLSALASAQTIQPGTSPVTDGTHLTGTLGSGIGSINIPSAYITGAVNFGAGAIAGPSNSLLWANTTALGTCTTVTECPINTLTFTDSVDASAAIGGIKGAQGLKLYENVVTGAKGYRTGLENLLRISSTPSDAGQTNYVAGVNYADAEAPLPGTNQSAIWALTNYNLVGAAANNLIASIGIENDMAIQSGGAALYTDGVEVVLTSANATAASRENAGFLVSAQSGATATMTCGYCFGGWQGNTPLASGASLMAFLPNGGSGSYPQASVTNGIDLNLVATSGFAWRGPNATSTIDGTGAIVGTTFSPKGTTCGAGNDWVYAPNANQIGFCANGAPLLFTSSSSLNAANGMNLQANGLTELNLANTGAPTLSSPAVVANNTAAQNVNITAGNASGTGGTSNGGSVVITAGTSSSGTAGSLKLVNIAASSAAQAGTYCGSASGASTSTVTIDTTLACLSSDERLKNVSTFTPAPSFKTACEEESALIPIDYTWKTGAPRAEGDPGSHIGMGAFATAYADERLIARGADGQPRGWREDAVIALGVACHQEQEKRLAKLEARQ